MAPKRKNPASMPSTPKKSKTSDEDSPKIQSVLVKPRLSTPVPKPISTRQRELYDMLREELNEADEAGFNARGRLLEKAKIAATIGLLHAMDDEHITRMKITTAVDLVVGCGPQAQQLLDMWKGGLRHQKAIPRSTETRTAQAKVAKWYNHMCAITGIDKATESCHILNNAIERSKYGKSQFLCLLQMFWGAEEVDNLRTILTDPKHELRNILVLQSTVHKMWDTIEFSLSLLPGFTDERQELEFVWLGLTSERAISYENPTTSGIGLTSLRGEGSVHSGDKVILTTSDPAKYPLPHAEFFQLRHNLHTALLCSGHAEVLERVFRRQPPSPLIPANNPVSQNSDDDDDGDDNGVLDVSAPDFAEYLMNSALALGIIREDEVPDWRLLFDPTCTDPSRPLYESFT